MKEAKDTKSKAQRKRERSALRQAALRAEQARLRRLRLPRCEIARKIVCAAREYEKRISGPELPLSLERQGKRSASPDLADGLTKSDIAAMNDPSPPIHIKPWWEK